MKNSKLPIDKIIRILVDLGYLGIKSLYLNSEHPIKKKKNLCLSLEEKRFNRALSSERILVENVIGVLKVFKIIGSKYRGTRHKFFKIFNLISGIYNYES